MTKPSFSVRSLAPLVAATSVLGAFGIGCAPSDDDTPETLEQAAGTCCSNGGKPAERLDDLDYLRIEDCGHVYEKRHLFRNGQTIRLDVPANFALEKFLGWTPTAEALAPTRVEKDGGRAVYTWKIVPFMLKEGAILFRQADVAAPKYGQRPALSCSLEPVADPDWRLENAWQWVNMDARIVLERSVDLGALPAGGLILTGPNFGDASANSRFLPGGNDKTPVASERIALGRDEAWVFEGLEPGRYSLDVELNVPFDGNGSSLTHLTFEVR